MYIKCSWLRTKEGDCMYHGGPVDAFCTLSRNSSALGPLMSAAVIYSQSLTSGLNLIRFW